jgi:hypothetical protein
VINDKFAGLSEALFTAEAKAREAINMRAAVQKELLLKEKVGGLDWWSLVEPAGRSLLGGVASQVALNRQSPLRPWNGKEFP